MTVIARFGPEYSRNLKEFSGRIVGLDNDFFIFGPYDAGLRGRPLRPRDLEGGGRSMDRRTFLRGSGLLAAAAFARPLMALQERSAAGEAVEPELLPTEVILRESTAPPAKGTE
jgi:hypothetical protein